MATSNYFPPLHACLSGASPVLPWTVARDLLSNIDSAASDTTIETFIRDPSTRSVLSQPLQPLSAPSPASKAAYDDKTAQIHVTQSPSGQYDLQQLKDDATWLSREVGIDELSALRCVIVEWQARPADLVLGRLEVEDDGPARKRVRFNDGGSSGQVDGQDQVTEKRRSRLLRTWVEETSAVRACSAVLAGLATDTSSPRAQTWLGLCTKSISEEMTRSSASPGACIHTLRSLTDVGQWPSAIKQRPLLEALYSDHMLLDLINVLRILLSTVYASEALARSADVISWYKLMGDSAFFAEMTPLSPASQIYIPTIQCLGSIISVALLNLTRTVSDIASRTEAEASGVAYPELTRTDCYYANEQCMKEVNSVLLSATEANAQLASPAIYVWSLITQSISECVTTQRLITDETANDSPTAPRSSSRGQRPMMVMERILDVLQDHTLGEQQSEPARYFAAAAVDSMHVHQVIERLSAVISDSMSAPADTPITVAGRIVLFDVLQVSLPLIQYGEEVLGAAFSLLGPDVPGKHLSQASGQLAKYAFDSPAFRTYLLEQVLARYPYELSPVLRLSTALASLSTASSGGESIVMQYLDNLDSMTLLSSSQFRDYQIVNEDEGQNQVQLTTDWSLFTAGPAFSRAASVGTSTALVSTNGSDMHEATLVKSGTLGTVLNPDSRPFVFRWEHQHSGLAYLGVLLSTLLSNSDRLVAEPKSPLDNFTAAEIVDLITALLKAASMRDHAEHILGRFGDVLSANSDIVGVIAELADTELMAFHHRSAGEGSLELLVSCIAFFTILTSFSPERVWSWLVRSALLGIESGISGFVAVVSAAEVPTGRFRFLSACSKLFTDLVDDAITGLVRRRPAMKMEVLSSRRRWDSPMENAEETPERTISAVLTSFTTLANDILRSVDEWEFTIAEERIDIVTTLLSTATTLLKSAYGAGPPGDATYAGFSLAGVLAPAAAAHAMSALSMTPILVALQQGLALSDNSLATSRRQVITTQTIAALSHLTTIIRTAKHSEEPTGAVAAETVKAMPTLAALFATSSSFKTPIAELLNEVLTTSSSGDPSRSTTDEVPSVLSQLSAPSTKHLLTLLSHLDIPSKDSATECAIWAFFSAVLQAGNQHFFAMYLLTGSLPREKLRTLNGSPSTATKGTTVLAYALEQLAGIRDLPPDRAIALLTFIARAQEAWIFATTEVRKGDFVQNALAWLEELRPAARGGHSVNEALTAKEYIMASLIPEILAVNLHASSEVGDKSLLNLMIPRLGFLASHAARVDGYNVSLHWNLARNLPERMGVDITDFRRTAVSPAEIGDAHVYDVELADRVLGHLGGWAGERGFQREMQKANLNLSLVDAETRLLQSWRTLASELADSVQAEPTLRPVMIVAAKQALEANLEATLETPYAAEMLQTRAELAFVLVERLTTAKVSEPEMTTLLPVAWSLVKSSPANYDVATLPEDLTYYTALLQMLYLALRPHIYISPTTGERAPPLQATQRGSIALDIAVHTIAPAFRALCANLHSSTSLALPSNFALITSLLRGILAVPGAASLHAQLAQTFTSANLARGALSLFSWSHSLSRQIGDDNVYGELAIQLLVTLTSIPPLAEQVADDGTLVALSSASMSDVFRRHSGVGPFDQQPRLFAVWAEGFLPICLHFLSALGPRIAPQISAFLNSFPEQLERASTALSPRSPSPRDPHAGQVTLGLVKEARSLLLISSSLRAAADIGAAEGVDGSEVETLAYKEDIVRGDLEGLCRGERSLEDRVVAGSLAEEGIARTKQGRGLVEEVARVAKGALDIA
ncbi:hypothetical protein B0A48_08415 [Cryoendolithus antarcticus]|uniref:Nucleoporin NUP188 n=1 Tax=Cryoendolithus antarcticus TaxID=1507870 RepID=A0A1V8T5W6_9PEZI|nr:hypothetical protein B0A48_08415 [Cryoendolithus antarcticus]